MQIILLNKVQNLGDLGDTVSVKSGYARNFLIPSGHAVMANKDNQAEFELRRAELERQQADVVARAKARAKDLETVSVSISRKAGEEGRLFGSVGNIDVVNALVAAGHQVERSEVSVPQSIRQTGEYAVEITLHADVHTTVQVMVVAED